MIETHPERLSVPLKRKKPTVYAVWNDLFHNEVKDGFQEQVYRVIWSVEWHTFSILTKRPQNMLKFVEWYTDHGVPLPDNVWNGLTVCNQQEADEKIPIFLQVPGKKLLSIEPMLGPINILKVPGPSQPMNEFSCIILGGETGPGARPMHPDWVRSVRNQCEQAGVPFFFKSWGEYIHDDQLNYMDDLARELDAASIQPDIDGFYKVGRKRAGRILDGRTHNDLLWVKS